MMICLKNILMQSNNEFDQKREEFKSNKLRDDMFLI